MKPRLLVTAPGVFAIAVLELGSGFCIFTSCLDNSKADGNCILREAAQGLTDVWIGVEQVVEGSGGCIKPT